MVMQPEPIYRCYLDIIRQSQFGAVCDLYVAAGSGPDRGTGTRTSGISPICCCCAGITKGLTSGFWTRIVDEEVSIGDYVLTGGELGALVLTDAVVRLCDGVLAADICFEEESHMNGLLEYPQYTRPEVWDGMEVPEVLRKRTPCQN